MDLLMIIFLRKVHRNIKIKFAEKKLEIRILYTLKSFIFEKDLIRTITKLRQYVQ